MAERRMVLRGNGRFSGKRPAERNGAKRSGAEPLRASSRSGEGLFPERRPKPTGPGLGQAGLRADANWSQGQNGGIAKLGAGFSLFQFREPGASWPLALSQLACPLAIGCGDY